MTLAIDDSSTEKMQLGAPGSRVRAGDMGITELPEIHSGYFRGLTIDQPHGVDLCATHN